MRPTATANLDAIRTAEQNAGSTVVYIEIDLEAETQIFKAGGGPFHGGSPR